MVFFASTEFLLLTFLLAVLLRGVGRSGNSSCIRVTLLVGNLAFVALLCSGDWFQLFFLVAWSLLVFLIAWIVSRLQHSARSTYVFASQFVGIAVLVGFVFSQSLGYSIPTWFHDSSLFGEQDGVDPHRSLRILGLSYVTFRALHVIAEIGAGTLRLPTVLDLVNFLLFFPCLACGPLDRFDRFQREIDSLGRDQSRDLDWTIGFFRISVGLLKVLVLGSLCQRYSFPASLETISFVDLMKHGYAFTFFVYFDFSGASDIAIGCARLLGIKVPENFNFPLSSTSIQEFWSRWHISLSHWVRDYVFFPLEAYLGRKSWLSPSVRPAFSTIAAFTVIGMWHGVAMNFVLWGFLHGICVFANSLFRTMLRRKCSHVAKVLRHSKAWYATSWLLTFHLVVALNVIWVLPIEGLSHLIGNFLK